METMEASREISEDLKQLKASSWQLRKEGVRERKRRLRDLEKWILDNRDNIHKAVFADFRKSSNETDISEIFPVLTEIRDALKNLDDWSAAKKVSPSLPYLGTSARVVYEPKGLCLIISPWNYPFNLTVGPVVSALAAGNTLAIKPSEFTPHTSQLIQEMCEQLFGGRLVKVYQGNYQISQELLEYPFDHIFFTGSPRVGKIVMEAAARHLTSVTLELGGKSPTIIDDTADVKDAAEKIAWGKWLNAGQTCVAPDYVFVHERIKDSFVAELKNMAKKLYGQSKNYTGIISENHRERLNSLLQNAIDHGGKIEFSIEHEVEENRLGPVVLSEIEEKADIMEEEIFGPILPVMTYRDLDAVIDYVNQRPKPLALYFFSSSRSAIRRITEETTAGSMCVNDCVLQFSHPELPFGGVNNSGIGKAHGHYGFLAFSNEKSVLHQRKGMTMAKTLYPPYGGLKKITLNFLLKYF